MSITDSRNRIQSLTKSSWQDEDVILRKKSIPQAVDLKKILSDWILVNMSQAFLFYSAIDRKQIAKSNTLFGRLYNMHFEPILTIIQSESSINFLTFFMKITSCDILYQNCTVLTMICFDMIF